MVQYLCLHTINDNFAQTVQKARRFAATTDIPRPKKSVRISTPPAHDTVQTIQEDASLHDKVDRLESMIRSMQADTPKSDTPSLKNSSSSSGTSVKYVKNGGSSPKPPSASRTTGDKQKSKNNAPTSPCPNGQQQNNNKQKFVKPFDERPKQQYYAPRQWTPSQQTYATDGRTTPQQTNAPPYYDYPQTDNRQRHFFGCYICGQKGCYSFYRTDDGPQIFPARQQWTNNRSQTPPVPPGRSGQCWVCGTEGCRSWFHRNENKAQTPPVPPFSQSGNVSGTRPPGNRGPNLPARQLPQ